MLVSLEVTVPVPVPDFVTVKAYGGVQMAGNNKPPTQVPGAGFTPLEPFTPHDEHVHEGLVVPSAQRIFPPMPHELVTPPWLEQQPGQSATADRLTNAKPSKANRWWSARRHTRDVFIWGKTFTVGPG